MKLIPEWREGWKFWSIRIQAAGLFIIALLETIPETIYTAWLSLPPELHGLVPEGALKWVAYLTLISSIVARMIRQENLHSDQDSKGVD